MILAKYCKDYVVIIGLFLCISGISSAQTSDDIQDFKSQLEEEKENLIALNTALTLVEQDIIYPNDEQYSIYLSMNVGQYFSLSAIKININDEFVVSHIYTDKELYALQRGGIQELYRGNIQRGEYTLAVTFIGNGPRGREYMRGASLEFEKGDDDKYFEVKIVDNESNKQPDFLIKEW